MKQILERSRYIVLFGIAGTFFASVALFLLGFAGVFFAVGDSLLTTNPLEDDSLKNLSIILIQTIDVFLLATVLYVIAMGLYELFIDDTLRLPDWLRVHTLDDLKARLLGIVVVILPITFLGKLVDWKAGIDILWLGLAVGAVLIAIAATQRTVLHKEKK